MLEVAPKPGRDPLGDASFDPALRVHQRVGAEPLDRRRGRQSAGLDEPADQVLVRLRLFRFFAEPVSELTRRAAREGPESVQAPQLGKMLVPGLGPDRVVGGTVAGANAILALRCCILSAASRTSGSDEPQTPPDAHLTMMSCTLRCGVP